MASILDILNTKMGEDLIAKISHRTSESEDDISAALGIALPVLLGAVKKNISSPEGKESLNKALEEEKSYKLFTEDSQELNFTEAESEGEKMVDHILGTEKTNIISSLAPTLKMKESSVYYLFKIAAPLLLGILSSQKKNEQISSSGLDELIQSALGSSSKFDKSLIDTFFNRDKDGSIIDDVDEKILSGKKGKKGGSLLGGMTGGK